MRLKKADTDEGNLKQFGEKCEAIKASMKALEEVEIND